MESLPKVHVPEDFKVHASHVGEYPKLTPKPQPHTMKPVHHTLHSTGHPKPGTKPILGMQLPILTTKHKRPAMAYRG